ncbi:MAG: V-type ATP synthase subunit A [Nitrososphaerota archaeon]|nr:V-type ATP synthase subunit A [Nitrososphaerota archaeon]
MMKEGTIVRITGPVVTSEGLEGAKMFDVVRVGQLGLVGEVIKLEGSRAVLQIYEDTTGLRPGEKVVNTGQALSVELGPGLLTSIYDGIQRPLNVLKEKSGDFISRGLVIPALDEAKKWEFVPTKKSGDKVSQGEIIGTVQETQLVSHKIMIPPGVSGELKEIKGGKFTIREAVARVKTPSGEVDIFLASKWRVRTPRPISRKLPPDTPLLTGQRVFDTFFPVAKGGTAAIPGPFGSGKTVSQQQLAKWSDSRIIVYVGCGERGNEMTEVLATFPELEDPRSKRPLMERTILVANTSNMPVAAREASIYTGITIAEYYRDMGYDVALMADSTSRWAEALREISGRLEEMPGEEGYPAYLGSRLAEFYERSGKVVALSPEERIGSVTVVGAVSPPGGDFSEPVSQNTLRVTRVFWALDASLAARRHFPSINWLTSYSLYTDDLRAWYQQAVGRDFPDMRTEALGILQKEAELQDIVQLVGYDALPESEKGVMDLAKMIREDYLQQSAYDPVDTYTSVRKQYLMMKTILEFGKMEAEAIKSGAQAVQIAGLPVKTRIARIKWTPEDQTEALVQEIGNEMKQQFGAVVQEVKV